MVLLGLAAVIALVVWLIVAPPWRGSAADGPAPVASSTPTGDPVATDLPALESDGSAATPTPGPGSESAAPDAESSETADDAAVTSSAEPCVPGDLLVEAVTDKTEYAAGENPQLSIRLTNNGDACTLNVGTTGQVFTVMSGNDTWWKSTDCQAEPSDLMVLLEENQVVTSAAPITWDRTRSSVETCGATERQAAPAGGASYHLYVSIGGVNSTNTAQFLLL
ncbi:hypothetical protein FBY40_0258 [Microbacterium sp. SLBN-154]|nr:hypothetical protein FBY40_0258 [Microbacterium sp. SLBN-154]